MRGNLEPSSEDLSFEGFKKLLELPLFRYVALHGWGESLLVRDIPQMINYAEENGVAANLTSNGTLIEESGEELLSSGLSEIAFGIYDEGLLGESLGGIERFLHRKREGKFPKPRTYFDITIYKDNLSEIAEYLRVAKEIGIDAIVLHRLFNLHSVDPSFEYISEGEEKELFQELKSLTKKSKLKIYLPQKHELPCRIVKLSVFVNWKGEVTPCCFLPELALGNAWGSPISSILNSRAYIEFVRNMKGHPICSRCIW